MELFKYGSMQVCKYVSMIYAGMQVCKYASIKVGERAQEGKSVYKYVSMKACNHAILQVCKYT